MSDLSPEHPEDVGMEEQPPPKLTDTEAARTLADHARERLHAEGFDDNQIDAWANTYIAEVGSGDVDAFLEWIRHQEYSTQ